MKHPLTNFTILTVAALAAMLTSAPAQTSSQQGKVNSPDEVVKTRQVIASASVDSLRFTSLGELLRMRLEVIASSGEVLFDSDFKQGNLVDWALTNKQGQRLADGAYLCVVTVKDASTQLTRTQAIVSLLEQSVILKQADSAVLTAAQVQAAGLITDEGVIMTIIEPAESAATALLAHDGTSANLVSGSGGLSISGGDFFANKVLEHMRVTAEGNVGIGTRTPQARLDVDGLIRASRGIVYPDGTIQLSAASKTLGARSLMADQASKSGTKPGQENFEPQASGTGTQNHVARWSDNAGALGDSTIVDVGGSIGIGTPSPQTGLDYHNAQAPFFTRDFPTNPGNAVGALQLGLSNVGSRNANVGPSFLFFSENSGGAKSFLGRVSAVWENPTAGAEAGAIFFQVRANSADVNALTERMRITASGNVGIGTNAPGFKLDVADRIRLRQSASGSAGIWFFQSTPNNDRAFVGMQDDTHVGFFGNTGIGWGMSMNTTTGNIGIGTTAPSALLEARRDGNIVSNWQSAQLSLGGTTDSSMQLNLGYDTTNNLGVIQAGQSGVAFTNLLLNPFGGNVGIGSTTTPTARLGVIGSGIGIYGEGATRGVWGFSDGGNGVRGESPNGYGVRGDSTNGNAIVGFTTNGSAVYGDNNNSNTTGYAGFFSGRVNVAGNLDANNMPGVKNSQCSNVNASGVCDFLATGESKDFDKITVDVPASGFLFITASITLFTNAPTGDGHAQFNLFRCDSEACGGGVYLIRSGPSDNHFGGDQILKAKGATTITYSFVLPVEAPGPVTLKTNGTNDTASGDIYSNYRSLTAVYLPKHY